MKWIVMMFVLAIGAHADQLDRLKAGQAAERVALQLVEQQVNELNNWLRTRRARNRNGYVPRSRNCCEAHKNGRRFEAELSVEKMTTKKRAPSRP